jgi:hypothetical protein
MEARRAMLRTLLVLAGLLAAAQLLPYGRVENPPVRAEPAWDSPRTRELAVRACFDCHSNQSRRQWYHLAPASWWVADHVREAREHLNFSEWDRPQDDAEEAPDEVAEGEMPLRSYLLVHRAARLTAAERAELVSGLEATLAAADPGEDAAGGKDGEGEEGDGRRGRGRGRGEHGGSG